jgi:peptide/nickel transport system permease protein
MKLIRVAATLFMGAVLAACLFAGLITHLSYEQQFRDLPDAAPSRTHPLGTDELGRDRFSRLVYGTRVSLLLAPSAALLSCILAALIGGIAGFVGGYVERCILAAMDLFLSLPWLFLLITVRALLPLNVSPVVSVVITFALLGCLGWAAAARVICAGARRVRNSDFLLLARATGVGGWRLIWRHVIPNLYPVLSAQFWISIPVFILAEANLGILGLGVAEPLPSWGSLLRELESFSTFAPHAWQFAPLALFVAIISCFHLVLKHWEFSA